MSRLTLNSIPSLDAIQRQARTKDRHVKYHALNMQHNFHSRHFHSWHNMDQTVFMHMLCIPPMQPRYVFEWQAWFYQTSKSTMCGLQPTLHREQRYVLIEHVQRLNTLRQQSSRPSLVGAKPTLASFHTGATIHYKKAIYRSVDGLTSVILEALTRTHTQARITWQPAAFFIRCIQHKTQPEKWLRIRGKTWVRSASPSPPPSASVSCQLKEWTND